MVKRGFNYYTCLIFQEYVVGLPAIFFGFLGLYKCPFKLINGIRVVDPTPETRPYFTNAVAKALELIAASDAVRFGRVHRNIQIIVNAATPKFASCGGPLLKVCSVNFRYFYYPEFGKTAKLLASALVHAATYNYLIERGVVMTKFNQERYAAIRIKEACRFLRRVGMTDTPFDSEVERIAGWPLFKAGVKEMSRIFTRDPTAEAAIWKEQLETEGIELS